MAHDIVRFAHRSYLAKSADLDKGRIGVTNPALHIGDGNQNGVFIKQMLDLGYGQIGAHDFNPWEIEFLYFQSFRFGA